MACLRGEGGIAVDVLERRTLLSESGFTWSVRAETTGPTLVIQGTDQTGNLDLQISGADAGITIASGTGQSASVEGAFGMIEVRTGAGNDRVAVSGAIPARLYGGSGRDTLIGGSGDDYLYAGARGGLLIGGGGDDTFVSLTANAPVTLTGGEGTDSFWYVRNKARTIIDATAQERRIGAVHVMNLKQPVASRSANGLSGGMQRVSLPDPAVTDRSYVYQNFSTRPLFAADGPSPDDVVQGALGDCYALAVLSAVAETMPTMLRQVIADLGDGTYAVRFRRGGSETYVRVDADLPTENGQLAYAGFGGEGSIWVPLVEKAYASFRRGVSRYATLDGGWMSETLSALGLGSVSFAQFRKPEQLLTKIQSLLQEGKAVTYATKSPHGAPLVSYHAYTVVSVISDASGRLTGLRLRNPWAVDGAGNDGNDDGYVTVTAEQALQTLWRVQASKLSEAAVSA